MNKLGAGQALWNRAVEIIPGGNGLLSKRPQRYSANSWPIYFSEAKGCKILDLDNNEFYDMSQNGIGTSILGYANEKVNMAVHEAVNKGVNTTLNCPEEVELAELILGLHPDLQSVRFAKGGGEAMSIAIRIARAHTSKDKILFSGYHGWTDWYIASNIESKNNLDNHLLSGLLPKGVPTNLSGTSIPFLYNDSDDFIRKAKLNKDIAAIVIEGARYSLPTQEFLNVITKFSKENDVPIIVDEITSGWRMSKAGVYQEFNFDPDIVVYGKALGNGFPISAVLGKMKIMDSSQDSFISSTMWTERVGFSAAIATINELQEKKVYKKLTKLGKIIDQGWKDISKKYNIKLKTSEFLPLITFKLDYGNLNNLIETLFIQEMLKDGYLATSSVYLTDSHDEINIQNYLKSCDKFFRNISSFIEDKNNLEKMLNSPVRTDAFTRVTK